MILLGGVSLWCLAVGVMVTTGDEYVTGAVVLGTFVVPLSLSVRFADRESLPGVGSKLMVRLFVGGGLLGFLASAFFEQPLNSQPVSVFDGGVGAMEETAKLMVLVLMTRSVAEKGTRSGFVLGGLVGLGFSAFESAGYAVASVVSSGRGSGAIIETVFTRAAITPFTHGLWTAITGAALFASSRNGRFRPSALVTGALVAVAALHACWDLMPNLTTSVYAQVAGASPANATRLSGVLLDDVGWAILSLPPLCVAYRLRPRKQRDPAPSQSVPMAASRPRQIDCPAA